MLLDSATPHQDPSGGMKPDVQIPDRLSSAAVDRELYHTSPVDLQRNDWIAPVDTTAVTWTDVDDLPVIKDFSDAEEVSELFA
jgi:hypothetical protein